MATVIDKLIVELGLDPKDFEAGKKKTAAGILDLQKTTKTATTNMGADFVSFTKKLLGIASAVALIKGAVGGILRMSTEIRDLGRESRNLGTSAANLRNWGNAYEALGGNSKDALNDIQTLQKSLFDLNYMGSASPQLEALTRLGVAFQDATGHARAFGDVAKDAGEKARELVKTGQMTRTDATFMLQAAGFSSVASSAMLDNTLLPEVARQAATHKQINKATVDEATSVEKSRVEMHQDREDVAITTMRDAEKAAEALEMVTDKFSDALMRFISWVDDNILPHGASSAYEAPAAAHGAAGAIKDPAKMLITTKDGKTVARETLGSAEQALTAPRSGLAGWLQRAGANAVAQKPAPTPVAAPPAGATSAAAMLRGAPAAAQVRKGNASTTINVGPVSVQTAATDANGIAGDMRGAVQRKMNVAQVEPGMQ